MAAIDASPRADGSPGRRETGAPESLWRQLHEARADSAPAHAQLDRYRAARQAFAEISGLMLPAHTRSPNDIQRLRILDAVILELSAVERELYVAVGDEAPDAMHAAYAELRARLNPPVTETQPAPAEAPQTLLGRLRAGEAVTVHLQINRLSSAGLLALGQLLHFEPGLRWEAGDSLALPSDQPPMRAGREEGQQGQQAQRGPGSGEGDTAETGMEDQPAGSAGRSRDEKAGAPMEVDARGSAAERPEG